MQICISIYMYVCGNGNVMRFVMWVCRIQYSSRMDGDGLPHSYAPGPFCLPRSGLFQSMEMAGEQTLQLIAKPLSFIPYLKLRSKFQHDKPNSTGCRRFQLNNCQALFTLWRRNKVLRWDGLHQVILICVSPLPCYSIHVSPVNQMYYYYDCSS